MVVEQNKLKVFNGSLDAFLEVIPTLEGADVDSALGQLFWGQFPHVRLYRAERLVGSSCKKDVCNRGAVRVVPAAYNFLNEVKKRGPLAVSQLSEVWNFHSASTAGALAYDAHRLTKLDLLRTDVNLRPDQDVSWDILYRLGTTQGFSVEYRR